MRRRTAILGAGTLNQAVDKYGNNLLHLAVAAERIDLVQFGLNEGVDPWATNNVGKTPVQIALMIENFPIVNLLAEYMEKD